MLHHKTALEAARELNEKLDNQLKTYQVIAAPAGLANRRQYALYLTTPQMTELEQPGAWLGLSLEEADILLRQTAPDKIWVEWARSCTTYEATQTAEVKLMALVDYARRTWENYVLEIQEEEREAMAKPTPENVLHRLVANAQVDSSISPDQVRAVMDLLWISVKYAAWVFDVPKGTIRDNCQAGKIHRAEKRGRDWFFQQRAFIAWLRTPPGKGGRPKKKVEA